MVDDERVTWLRVFWLPCHVWGVAFFEFISKLFGAFLHADDNTSKQSKLDMVRFLIRMGCSWLINETINAKVNGVVFRLNLKWIRETTGKIMMRKMNLLSGSRKIKMKTYLNHVMACMDLSKVV